MFHIVLVEPQIPPNTGNIIRLCANTGCNLHLIKPLGFDLGEKQLRRAGMDYTDLAVVTVWEDWPSFIESGTAQRSPRAMKHTIRNLRFSRAMRWCLAPKARGW